MDEQDSLQDNQHDFLPVHQNNELMLPYS
jgi:hypothetical protein